MRSDLLKGAIAGATGGLVASYVMNQFQSLLAVIQKRTSQEQGQSETGGGEDATTKAAEVLSRHLFHHELSAAEKKSAGPLVHYAFGTVLGALYGILAQADSHVRAGYGSAYGSAVWLAADEFGVSAAGLSNAPTQYPASAHLKALAAHLVYGMTTDLVSREALRAMK